MEWRRATGVNRAAGIVLLATLGACARATVPPPTPKPAPDTTAQRAPEPSPAQAFPPMPSARLYAPVRLAFVGDINLGTLTLPDGIPPDSGRGLLDAARPALSGDLVVGNFEGVLADSGTTYKCDKEGRRVPADTTAGERGSRAARQRVSPKKERKRSRRTAQPPRHPAVPRLCYAFLTPTLLAPRLKDAGFTHLNLANNHANDFGADGRASTETILQGLGLRVYGPLGNIAIDTVRRGDSLATVALVGFSTYPHAYDLLDIARSVAIIDSVRPLVDLLVVTFHGGAEGIKALHVPEAAESLGLEPRGELRHWARAVIDAGADAVVGHGPHVLRGIEFYRGKPIVYSLGNFLTYRGFNLDGPLGVTGVLQLEFAPDRRLTRARLVPMRQVPRLGPEPDRDGAALELVRRLSAEDFPVTGALIAPDGEIEHGSE
jgi:Bacterial capsule synthesis protein PGA_cap